MNIQPNKIFTRKCPKCDKDLFYTTYRAKAHSIKNNCFCFDCSSKNRKCEGKTKKSIYTRNCPICNAKVSYKNYHSHRWAELNRSRCQKCHKENCKYIFNTQEFKDKISLAASGSKNGMYGKTFYEVWVNKYGKEIADQKLIDLKNKMSINNSGKNNPMYGKPSPQGSGNGWSGWYKGWFFRSLIELSYVIDYLEHNNINWKSCESVKIKIQYKNWENTERTYVPDFIINNDTIIECKPKRLWKAPNVKAKTKAAKKYCKNNGLKFKLVDSKKISIDKILELKNKGDLIFTNRYEQKFNEMLINGRFNKFD